MIDGMYDVALDTPRHHKRGLLSLEGTVNEARAVLLLNDEKPLDFSGPRTENDFAFEGAADFPGMGLLAYSAKGNVWGNSITISFVTDEGNLELFGTRLSTQAGDFKSSHDYMLKGGNATFEANDNTMYSGLFGDGG